MTIKLAANRSQTPALQRLSTETQRFLGNAIDASRHKDKLVLTVAVLGGGKPIPTQKSGAQTKF